MVIYYLRRYDIIVNVSIIYINVIRKDSNLRNSELVTNQRLSN